MTDISIQFHALPEEVTAFARQCMEDFDLHAVAMKFFPFEAVAVTSEEMGKLSEATRPYEELAFTLDKPLLPAKNTMDFHVNNPEGLCILLATPTAEGLRQIALSARTNDSEALAIWKKIAKRLKSITYTGVIVKNPDTGLTSPERTFRYTSGAKELASTGVPMLQVAGENVVIFSDS